MQPTNDTKGLLKVLKTCLKLNSHFLPRGGANELSCVVLNYKQAVNQALKRTREPFHLCPFHM